MYIQRLATVLVALCLCVCSKQRHKCLPFQVVTCETRTANPHRLFESISHMTTLRSTNICRNRTWTGYGMKLQMYSAFALNMSRAAADSKCEPVLIFIDADVLFNINRRELQKRWQDIGADIVVSAEMGCWIGRECTLQDFQKFYEKAIYGKRNSSSPFVNSGAFMGKAAAIADLLQNSPFYPSFNMEDTGYDDQYAFTQMSMTPLRNWTLRRDVTQSIFGSFLYNQNSSCPKGTLGRRFSCYDSIDQRFHPQECCSNDDIDLKLQMRMFQVVENGTNICAVVRPAGFKVIDNDEYIGTTNDFFWLSSFSRLHQMPVFWHGNGPGKPIFQLLQKQVERCRNNFKDQVRIKV